MKKTKKERIINTVTFEEKEGSIFTNLLMSPINTLCKQMGINTANIHFKNIRTHLMPPDTVVERFQIEGENFLTSFDALQKVTAFWNKLKAFLPEKKTMLNLTTKTMVYDPDKNAYFIDFSDRQTLLPSPLEPWNYLATFDITLTKDAKRLMYIYGKEPSPENNLAAAQNLAQATGIAFDLPQNINRKKRKAASDHFSLDTTQEKENEPEQKIRPFKIIKLPPPLPKKPVYWSPYHYNGPEIPVKLPCLFPSTSHVETLITKRTQQDKRSKIDFLLN